jgi:amidophosphoribosyltransferase
MLHEMRERGPDSAGFAVYGDGRPGQSKITVLAEHSSPDWSGLAGHLSLAIDTEVTVRSIRDHAVFTTDGDGDQARQWFLDTHGELDVLSHGEQLEIFKAVGDPDLVAAHYALAERSGTHAIAHTRMATESAVTTNGSHPFATGPDTCLVHNGSLSNHNQLRRFLIRHGETFQTENDTEVAAGFVAWRIREGDSLDLALKKALTELDGFYTFAIGIKEGFAILRDPIACKPAVIAETDDWVAMSSEYRALARLPGIDDAEIWEPQPAEIYTWTLDS